MISIGRYHDFSYGHRVYGHENKCSDLHGHNGRVYFVLTASELDDVGRVMDFGEVNRILCQWIENYWDHKFLLYIGDPLYELMKDAPGVIAVNFNPTAESLARELLTIIGPLLLPDHIKLTSVTFYETRKCFAIASL